jgi:hypothetical protein
MSVETNKKTSHIKNYRHQQPTRLCFDFLFPIKCTCNSYFHMSSAVRSLFRYEAEVWSTRRQPSDAKQAEYLTTDSGRILNNVFRVRLGKVLKNNIILTYGFSLFFFFNCIFHIGKKLLTKYLFNMSWILCTNVEIMKHCTNTSFFTVFVFWLRLLVCSCNI